MPTPKPPASLDKSCVCFHADSLYVYTPGVFFSIALEHGAKWSDPIQDVNVIGSACTATKDALYVVGGILKGTESRKFSGVQEFDFKSRKWKTYELDVDVMQNRTGHWVTHIERHGLLVRGGTTDESRDSSLQTFMIKTARPYTVDALASSGPATERHSMFEWPDGTPTMVAGGINLWQFVGNIWTDTKKTLSRPIDDPPSKRLASFTADDGSELVYVFDIMKSPMEVNVISVQDADDKGGRPKRLMARADLPKPNSTFAPDSMGPGVAMATRSDGLIAFASQDNLEFFDAKTNGWIDAATMFAPKRQLVEPFSSDVAPLSATSLSSASVAAATQSTQGTSSATSSSDAAAAVDQSKHSSGPSSNAILGITLGCILGLMALLGLILLLLRRRRRRQQPRPMGDSVDEKDSAAFAQGAVPVGQASSHFLGGHYPKSSRESWSSMAILMGRVGKDRPGLSRRLSNGTSRSSVSSLHKILKSTISKPIPQSATQPVLVGHDERNVAFAPDVAAPRPRPRDQQAETSDSTRRSSGWNRYWSGGSALQMLGLGPAKRNTSASEQSSHYSDVGNPVKVRQDSATVPPLNLDGRPEVSNVVSGSPMVAQFSSDVPSEGMSGKIVRASCGASSGYSSGIRESTHEAWDANGAGNWGASHTATASAHAPSYYFKAHTTSGSMAVPAAPPSGVSQQPQLAMAATSSDMSWLNLGEHSRR